MLDANHCPGAVQFLFRIPLSDDDGDGGGDGGAKAAQAVGVNDTNSSSTNKNKRPLRPWEARQAQEDTGISGGGGGGVRTSGNGITSTSTSDCSNKGRCSISGTSTVSDGSSKKGKGRGGDEWSTRFRTILHTGDCRAGPEMVEGTVAWLKGLKGSGKGGGGPLVDVVYLDTTYCDAKVCWLLGIDSIQPPIHFS